MSLNSSSAGFVVVPVFWTQKGPFLDRRGGIENGEESMPKIRKSHPPSLKAKVAAEAIKAHKTAAQIAQMFGVQPTQVGGWKKQALGGGQSWIRWRRQTRGLAVHLSSQQYGFRMFCGLFHFRQQPLHFRVTHLMKILVPLAHG